MSDKPLDILDLGGSNFGHTWWNIPDTPDETPSFMIPMIPKNGERMGSQGATIIRVSHVELQSESGRSWWLMVVAKECKRIMVKDVARKSWNVGVIENKWYQQHRFLDHVGCSWCFGMRIAGKPNPFSQTDLLQTVLPCRIQRKTAAAIVTSLAKNSGTVPI